MSAKAMGAMSAILLLVSMVHPTLTYAQATAAILGTVSDPTGAVIGGAQVQLKNTGTGLTLSSVTDEQGRYRFPELPIGEYEVQASEPGFQTVAHRGIMVTVGSNPVVDFKLPVGQSAETMLVAADVSLVETQSTSFGALIESRQIREL